MDRVLLDCMILSAGAAAVLGVGAYVFGTPLLGIYTSDKEVIQCGLEILSITTVPYFLCGIMDLIPGALRGMGHFRGADGVVCDRNSGNQSSVDLCIFPPDTDRCIFCLFLIRDPGLQLLSCRQSASGL